MRNNFTVRRLFGVPRTLGRGPSSGRAWRARPGAGPRGSVAPGSWPSGPPPAPAPRSAQSLPATAAPAGAPAAPPPLPPRLGLRFGQAYGEQTHRLLATVQDADRSIQGIPADAAQLLDQVQPAPLGVEEGRPRRHPREDVNALVHVVLQPLARE